MPIVAGIASSMRATKVVVCDAETGEVVRQGRAAHPPGTEVPPDAWLHALAEAVAGNLLDGVAAVGVAAQQHTLIALDEAGEVVRPALLWNDVRSSSAAADLIHELGGPEAWSAAVGVVPLAGLTIAKLRWLAEREPASADRVASVLLPHDWLTWRLLGGGPASQGGDPGRELTTDRGDASGTGYYSCAAEAYRTDLVEHAFRRVPRLPRVLGPNAVAGSTDVGVVVSAGTGDTMAVALGLGTGPGDVVISLGPSGTLFAVHDRAVVDATGSVSSFADATGAHLPVISVVNAGRVLSASARLLGVDPQTFSRLAMESSPGAHGLVFLPYLEGERTPALPTAAGTMSGLRQENMTPSHVARAAVEGMLCGLADAVDVLREVDVRVDRIILVGGGARVAAVGSLASAILGAPVAVPAAAPYVALGAARQAAWALLGSEEAPEWNLHGLAAVTTQADPVQGRAVRAQYAGARDRIHPEAAGPSLTITDLPPPSPSGVGDPQAGRHRR